MAWPSAQHHRLVYKQRHQAPAVCAGPQHIADHIADLANVLSEVESSFEPQFNGTAALAAGIAAAPPLLFWFTVWSNAQRAIKKAEEKEQARLVSLRKMAVHAGVSRGVCICCQRCLITCSHLVVPMQSWHIGMAGLTHNLKHRHRPAKVQGEQMCNAATRSAACDLVSPNSQVTTALMLSTTSNCRA